MNLSEESRRQLRRANTLVAGLLLRAKFAKDQAESRDILIEAALTYALLDLT